MPKYRWERTSFTGIHTEQAKTENGEAYAFDMANLRIDGNGWLQPRSALSDLGELGLDVEGVATTPTYAFFLRNGRVHVAPADDLSNETTLDIVDDLEGRISVVDYGTYVVLTSEGNDNGYWIDLRDADSIEIHTLGVDAPPASGLTAAAAVIGQVDDTDRALGYWEPAHGTNHPIQRQYQLLYKMTYVRRHARGFPVPNPSPPFYGMESPASDNVSVMLRSDQNAVRLDIIHSQDPQITGVIIYRNNPFLTNNFKRIQRTQLATTARRFVFCLSTRCGWL